MDLKSIPVNVPAATVLRSSSASLAFSMATPNTLYKRAVEKEKPTFYYYAQASTINYTDVIFFCTSCLNTMHFLPTDPSVLAHDAPCRVTMFKILNITKTIVKVELWVINSIYTPKLKFNFNLTKNNNNKKKINLIKNSRVVASLCQI